MTDPPYSIDMRAYEDASENWSKIINICDLCPSSLAAFFMTPRYAIRFGSSLKTWNVERLLWWHKTADIGFPWHGWHMNSEAILIAQRPDAKWPKRSGHSRSDVYRTGPEKKKPPHPCAKPVSVIIDLVNRLSKKQATILDPFMGSCTTGIACIRTGRPFIGIELEMKYFNLACRRCDQAFEEFALFEKTAPAKIRQESLPFDTEDSR